MFFSITHFGRTCLSCPTFIGYLGVLMWAFTALLASTVAGLPVFEVLAGAFGMSFLLGMVPIVRYRAWHVFKQSPACWLWGVVGIFGNEWMYLSAFRYAPAVHADLINYLWPIFVILLSALLLGERLHWNHLLASLLAFGATFELLTAGQGWGGIQMSYMPGYLLALGSALIWSLYTLMARRYPDTSPERIALYCGTGALIAAGLHLHYEVFVWPTWKEGVTVLVMGLTTHGLAYYCWQHGMRFGHYRLLSILCYFNPILSVLLLVSAGLAQSLPHLWIIAFCIATAGLLMSAQPHLYHHRWKNRWMKRGAVQII